MAESGYEALKAEVQSLRGEGRIAQTLTDEERMDWAYGNTVAENGEITREMVKEALGKVDAPMKKVTTAEKLDAAIRELDAHGGSEQIGVIKVESVRVAVTGIGLTVDEVRRALVYCRERCPS